MDAELLGTHLVPAPKESVVLSLTLEGQGKHDLEL